MYNVYKQYREYERNNEHEYHCHKKYSIVYNKTLNGTEAFMLNSQNYHRLTFVINRLFMKLFRTKHQFGFDNPSVL